MPTIRIYNQGVGMQLRLKKTLHSYYEKWEIKNNGSHRTAEWGKYKNTQEKANYKSLWILEAKNISQRRKEN